MKPPIAAKPVITIVLKVKNGTSELSWSVVFSTSLTPPPLSSSLGADSEGSEGVAACRRDLSENFMMFAQGDQNA